MSTDSQNTNPENQDGLESQSSQSKTTKKKTGKAGSSKKMTAKEQSERFIQTARELEVDESGKKFEYVMENLKISSEN